MFIWAGVWTASLTPQGNSISMGVQPAPLAGRTRSPAARQLDQNPPGGLTIESRVA